MKHPKKRLFFLLAGVALAGMVLVAVAFNVVMRNYIDDQALQALQSDLQWFSVSLDDMGEEQQENTSLFTSDALYLDDSYTLQRDWIVGSWQEAEALANYCKANQDALRTGEIHATNINGQRYYLAQVNPLEDAEERFFLELYVNVAPMQKLTDNINFVFLVVLVVACALACFAGWRTGVSIENAENKMKCFFQNASHELKTPIMSIQGYAEGIQTGVLTDTVAASAVILQESDRMTQLVEELLALSKLESGAVPLQLQCLDLAEVLYECLERIQWMAQKQGIALDVQLPQSAVYVRGDEAQLCRAFSNILTNALRYAATKIALRAEIQGKRVYVWISDDGGGIAPVDLPHIFDRFYRGEKGNTGIGLALTQEIISLHRGKVCARNEARGACFEIWLPLNAA